MIRWIVAAIGVVLVAVGVSVIVRTPQLDVQGHRGARGELPENTLPAFARAQEVGVTTLELDTKVTSDGVLVVTHDDRLNPAVVRDSSGRWVPDPGPAVIDLTSAELQSYDVGRLKPGSDYAAKFPRQQAIDGTRIPTLAALFDQVEASGDTRVRFNIETKLDPPAADLSPAPEVFATKLVEAVRARGLASRVSIQSFDWRTLKHVHSIAPEIATVALTKPDEALLADGSWTAGLPLGDYGSVPALVAASAAGTWSPNFTVLTPDLVAEAHRRGLLVVPWTVNEPGDMARLMDWGVDGMISDYPDMAVSTVSATRRTQQLEGAGVTALGVGCVIAAVVWRRKRREAP